MKLRAILLDDESHCIETLSWQLGQYCPNVEIIATFTKPLEALAQVAGLRPDVVFLDVEMPRLNGFDWLKQFPKIDFEVVFTTAYDDFAIQAFQVSALDYLLKPVKKELLLATVEKLGKRFRVADQDKQIDILMHTISPAEYASRPGALVALPTLEGLEFIQPAQLLHIESDNNYCWLFFLQGDKKLITRSIKEMENMLRPHGFLRVHNSHIVNLSQLKQYIRGDGGQLILSNETVIPVSRSRKRDLLEKFDS